MATKTKTKKTPLLTWQPYGKEKPNPTIIKRFTGKAADRLPIPMYYLDNKGAWTPIQNGFAIPRDCIQDLIDVLAQGLALPYPDKEQPNE
jgi:hypothetical protein